MAQTREEFLAYHKRYYWGHKEEMNAASRARYAAHQEEANAYSKRYAAEHPEQTALTKRRYKLKRKYGITPEDFDALWEKQDGLCAICRSGPASCIDHDHNGGHVRGLLCPKCNRGLGNLGDSAESIERALDYLRCAQR